VLPQETGVLVVTVEETRFLAIVSRRAGIAERCPINKIFSKTVPTDTS
jgi:hypothetical protein